MKILINAVGPIMKSGALLHVLWFAWHAISTRKVCKQQVDLTRWTGFFHIVMIFGGGFYPTLAVRSWRITGDCSKVESELEQVWDGEQES